MRNIMLARFRPLRLHLHSVAVAKLIVLLTLASVPVLASSPAAADLRLCNKTANRVGIAIGYRDQTGWASEGWWNLEGNACETLLRGRLTARYYYLYAIDYDEGGEWSGKANMCTQDEMFTIRGAEECDDRGYARTGFFEIDTGEQQSWTVQLTEPVEESAAR